MSGKIKKQNILLILSGMFPRGEDITVRLPGGELVVNVGDRVLMTGEARMVFTGETEL